MFNCACDCNLGFWESFHKTGIGIVAWSLFSKRVSSVIQGCFQKAVFGFHVKLVSDSPSIFKERITAQVRVEDADLSKRNTEQRYIRNPQSSEELSRFTFQSAGPSTNELSSSELNDPVQGTDVVPLGHQTIEDRSEHTVQRRKTGSRKPIDSPSNEYKPLASALSDWVKSLRK